MFTVWRRFGCPGMHAVAIQSRVCEKEWAVLLATQTACIPAATGAPETPVDYEDSEKEEGTVRH